MKQPHYLVFPAAKMAEIIPLCAGAFGCKVKHLIGPGRKQPSCIARHTAIYIAAQCTNLPLRRIAAVFNREHHTVFFSIDAVKKRMAVEPAFAAKVSEIMNIVSLPSHYARLSKPAKKAA